MKNTSKKLQKSFKRSLAVLVGMALIMPAMLTTSCIEDDGVSLNWPVPEEFPPLDKPTEQEVPPGQEPERDKGLWTVLGTWRDWNDNPVWRLRLIDNVLTYNAPPISGNANGYWHSHTAGEFPYWVAIKLEQELTISGFLFWNRAYLATDNGHHFPKDVVFYVSSDEGDDANAIAWTEVLRVTLPDSGQDAVERPPFAIPLSKPMKIRCFKMEILNNYRGAGWTYIQELDVMQPDYFDAKNYPGISTVE